MTLARIPLASASRTNSFSNEGSIISGWRPLGLSSQNPGIRLQHGYALQGRHPREATAHASAHLFPEMIGHKQTLQLLSTSGKGAGWVGMDEMLDEC